MLLNAPFRTNTIDIATTNPNRTVNAVRSVYNQDPTNHPKCVNIFKRIMATADADKSRKPNRESGFIKPPHTTGIVQIPHQKLTL